jgi:hypothetical protein
LYNPEGGPINLVQRIQNLLELYPEAKSIQLAADCAVDSLLPVISQAFEVFDQLEVTFY